MGIETGRGVPLLTRAINMQAFNVSADVVNIYGNGQNKIATIYKAENKEKALQGFTDYLKSNKNLVSFSNIQIKKA